MAEAIRLGRMTDTMEEGFVADVLIKVGDTIKAGDAIAEVETDKATMPLESYYNGTILHVSAKKGEALPIGGLIAIVGKPGEAFEHLLGDAPAAVTTAAVTTAAVTTAAVTTTAAITTPVATPAQPAVASTPATTSSDSDRVKASPLAKVIAKDKGIDLSKVSGSGPDGRIIKTDLEHVSSPTAPAAMAVASYTGLESHTDTKVSQMRKTIAKRLLQSKNENPHFYLTIDMNMDKAVAMRTELNAILPVKVSFNDFVIKAVALSLRQHPGVNSSWMGDTIRQYGHVHIGMAVAVDEGLVVPVIKFADGKSLSQISSEAKSWGEKAKNKKLLPTDMEGSTFTISNLGMFGIEEFTAIINEPNACILAIGAIRQVPAVVHGEIKIANMMKVTLSSDHRVVDGVVGARFLQTFQQLIEEPLRMMA
jgi:pyruvate dehydrogenase E2 component (dihydrolipoamide acetyltransferase)